MNVTAKPLLSSWLAGGVLLGLVALATAGHLLRVMPPLPLETPPAGQAVDVGLAEQADSVMNVESSDRTAALRAALLAAKAETFDVPLQIVSPATTAASLVAATGQALSGVTVLPMAPNGVQPCVTPEGGLRGTLLVVTSAVLAKAPSFTGCIAVVDAAAPPRELGLNWENYANLGFSAILVTHRDGLPAADWNVLQGSLVSAAPLPFPRGVATPAILQHDGAAVVLTLRQDLRARAVTGLVARLPAATPGPAEEAIILLANLDEARAVGDLAAGAEQRLGAAWLTAAVTLLGNDPTSRRRDVLVIAAPGSADAQDGLVQLVTAIGVLGHEGDSERQQRSRELATDTAEADLLRRATALVDGGWLSAGGHSSVTDHSKEADPTVSSLLGRELAYVLGTIVVEAQTRAVQASLTASRAPTDAAARDTLINAKRLEARLGLLINFEPAALVQRKAELLTEFNVVQRLRTRLAERQVELAASSARHAVSDKLAHLMSSYHRVMALAFAAPGDGQAAWAMPGGANERRPITEELIAGLTVASAPFATSNATLIAPWSRSYADQSQAALGGCPLPTSPCTAVGWPAATLVSFDSGRRMQRSTWPTADAANSLQTSSHSLPALLLVQRLVAGARDLPAPTHPQLMDISGTVLASGVGGAAVPTHPLSGALVGDKPRGTAYGVTTAAGVRITALLQADQSGRYARRAAPLTVSGPYMTGWSPTAVTFGADGLVQRHSDESTMVQNIAHSLDRGNSPNQQNVDLVCFRAVPLALLDRLDPRTMRTFAAVEFVRSAGLSAPTSVARYDNQPGPQCWFLAPDERLAVLLKTGSEDNPLALRITSFLLGSDARGLLAADGPYILEAQRQSAASLANLNSNRLTSAISAGLADQRTSSFNRTGTDLLLRAGDAAVPLRERILAARDAGSYGQIVYTELRGSISSAISSIVWYLFLLVPFAFFLERLAFGFADIRRAITTHAVIFLSSFTLLGLLHPAFRLVGSPVMILLGFVILMISLAVSGLFLARAKENLEVFNRRRGGVSNAQPDLLGIISTSIALGINGLSRRKVRTGLTCATLSLITLCLILFVSARSGLVETTKPNGPTTYQGFIIRGQNGRSVPVEELLALRLRYGQEYTVIERQTSIGTVDWQTMTCANPELPLVRSSGENATARGLLRWSAQDPLLHALRFTAGGLITEKKTEAAAAGAEAAVAVVAPRPLVISGEMAEQLGVRAADLPASVTIAGSPCLVTGIFDSSSLAVVRDLDGRLLLPFDLTAMSKLKRGKDGATTGTDDDPLIEARSVIISDDRPFDLAVPNLELRTTTCAVILDNVPYRQARELIDRRMEQTGQPVSYGLDGVATTGRSARASALDGLADMLIPLLIAGLTVLNTMRGSVYERRDEIAVYNAVGIAPRFISAMFFSEALVFAVVGSVLGYLLSLLLGRVLSTFGWEAGLQVDYASLTPVWASLALAAVVFISTWFPARAAAEIAAPSDDAGWRVPAPVVDELSFPLPFAFGARDRIAVLAFFQRVFADHGDGGGGSFQCDHIAVSVIEHDDSPLALISCQVWLKPFDLGVAQKLTLALHPDPETGEWLAHLTLSRQSGTRESWLRLNRPFIAALRQRFLHWRAVDAATRDELHAEAIGLLRGTHVHV